MELRINLASLLECMLPELNAKSMTVARRNSKLKNFVWLENNKLINNGYITIYHVPNNSVVHFFKKKHSIVST